ncbi:MAG: NTP transferase domain-containing protein [Senegalimassilia faecalis]
MTSPTDKPLSHACIIMASGSGTRFGGNKLMANLAGMPLVEHVLRATEGHFAERVVVTRHADVAQLARKTGARAVVHDLPLRNEAVALGMDALTCCDTVTFFQGDQPLVAARTIDTLLAAAERDPGCIWRASFREQPGAPVLFPPGPSTRCATCRQAKAADTLRKPAPITYAPWKQQAPGSSST